MSDVVHADEKALQQAALDRLKLIGAVTRYQADAIRLAVEVGIPKQRIHELTGRSRSAIDQTLAREALRPRPPCDYCLHEHFQAARRGEDVPVVVEYSAAALDLGLRHRHDRHPCLSRCLTGCW